MTSPTLINNFIRRRSCGQLVLDFLAVFGVEAQLLVGLGTDSPATRYSTASEALQTNDRVQNFLDVAPSLCLHETLHLSFFFGQVVRRNWVPLYELKGSVIRQIIFQLGPA